MDINWQEIGRIAGFLVCLSLIIRTHRNENRINRLENRIRNMDWR